jgi:hypothetical protein
VQVDAAVESVSVGVPLHWFLASEGGVPAKRVVEPEPASWLPVSQAPTERSTLGHGSRCDPAIQLGADSTHPPGGQEQYPVAAAERGRHIDIARVVMQSSALSSFALTIGRKGVA